MKTKEKNLKRTVLTVLSTIVCILVAPIILVNITLLVRSYTAPDEVPSVGGVFPLIVLSDSMYPEIQGGDLIICRTEDAENIQEGDVISFFDPAGNGTSVVTHRVIEVIEEDGEVKWITKGDANNALDSVPVSAEDLVGIYLTRIPDLGNVVMFMQSSTGLIVCVIIPIFLLAGWDYFRRKKYDEVKEKDTEALMKELEALRSQQEQKETTADPASNHGME